MPWPSTRWVLRRRHRIRPGELDAGEGRAGTPRRSARGGGLGGGVLTHGGSLANLTALMAARARIDPEAWQDGDRPGPGGAGPEACHYSIARALGIMGLGRRGLPPHPPTPTSVSAPTACRRLSAACATRAAGCWPWWPTAAAPPPGSTTPCARPAPSAGRTACGCTWTPPTAPRRCSRRGCAPAWTASNWPIP